jgi:hypothetical protein
MWQLRNIELTDKEVTLFANRNGFERNEIMRKYLVWRKSSLLVAGIFLSLTAVTSLVGMAMSVAEAKSSGEPSLRDYYSGLGRMAEWSRLLSPVVLAIAVWAAFYFWLRKPFTSFRVLTYGWLVALILSLWPLVVPFQYFLRGKLDIVPGPLEAVLQDTLEDFVQIALSDVQIALPDGTIEDLAQIAFRAFWAVSFAIDIFPVIVAVPSGIIRGSLRVRGLLPECSLAGWLIVITSPLYPLLVLVALVLVSQLLGSVLLLLGAFVFMAAPTLYIFRRKLYTKPKLTAGEISQINWTQRIISGLTLSGLFLIAVGALAYADDLPVPVQIEPSAVASFMLSFLGNQFCSTVVFADIVLRTTMDSLSQDQIADENTILGGTKGMLHQLEADFYGTGSISPTEPQAHQSHAIIPVSSFIDPRFINNSAPV